jgi:hypothetical protein
VVAGSIAAGYALMAIGWIRIDHLPPLHAHPRPPSAGLLPVVPLVAVLVLVLPRLAATWPWRRLLPTAWALAVGWAVALAASDGFGAVARPLTYPTEYLTGLPAVGDHPLRWLRGFAESLPSAPTHVQGHPPLPVLILWGLRRAGLGGPGWAATLIIVVGGSSVVAIAIAMRRVAGEPAARRAVPFLVLAPFAVWIATSMDALFLGVGAWGVALLALGCGPGRSPVWAFAGGVALGALPYLSYGLVPLLAVPLTVVLVTRPRRAVVAGLAAGMTIVPVAFTAAGFWWFDGVAATHAAWAAGAGARRPYPYFLIGDLAVLALTTGPAVARALAAACRRAPAPATARGAGSEDDPRPDREPAPAPAVVVLAAAALAGVVVLDLAGVTRGEVERIWLPYAAWIVTVTAALRPGGKGGLAAQGATALALQAFVRSPW